jgi:hypothetical protein
MGSSSRSQETSPVPPWTTRASEGGRMSVRDAQDAPGAQPDRTTGGNPFVSLVLGGARSGKSSFAEAEVLAHGLDCL